MMFRLLSRGKVFYLFLFLLIIFNFNVVSANSIANNSNNINTSAMILYDGNSSIENLKSQVNNFYTILRMYCTNVSNVQIQNYYSGLLKNVQYVFIIGADNSNVNKQLGQDLKNFSGKIVWIGGGIERYSSFGLMNGFQIMSYCNNISELDYNFENAPDNIERILTGKIEKIPEITVNDNLNIKSYGSCKIDNKSIPFAINNDNIWCLAIPYVNGEIGTAIRDIFDRVFNKTYEEHTGVYIKINDVSPFSDFETLSDIGTFMENRGIPFIIELRPIFKNVDSNQMKRFADLIRKMQDMGGTTVLGNLSGWKSPDEWSQDLSGNAPLSNYEDMVPEKLMEASFKAYVNYGVYPVAFSAPTDVFFDDEINPVLKHFSTFIEKGNWEGYIKDQGPANSWNGNFISSSSNLIESKEIKNYDNYVLEFNDLNKLKKSINNLMSKEVEFKDFRQVNNQVNFEGINLTVNDGQFFINGNIPSKPQNLDVSQSNKKQVPLSEFNQRVKQMINFIIGIIAIFIFGFLIAFLTGKKIDRKKHLR